MDISTAKQVLENGSKGFRASGHSKVYGQIALRVDENYYLLTKDNIILSSVNKDTDIDVCDINTGALGEFFNRRTDVNAFVFACTEASVKVSKDRSSIRSSLDDFSEKIGHSVQIIDSMTIDNIIRVTMDSPGCIVSGSGIVGTGATIEQAVSCVQIIEKCCKAELHAEKLGGIKYIPENDVTACREFYKTDYYSMNEEGVVNVVGFDEDEYALRNSMIEFGKKLCDKDLVYGTWGNISIKLSDDEMLISPSGMDYFNIKPEDIVKVNFKTLEYNKMQRIPSRNMGLHAKMYQELQGCNAIVHTHSANLSCFAAAHAGFMLNDPALKTLIGDVLSTDYALEHEDEYISNALDKLRESHAVILANHGAIFYGPSMDIVLAIASAVEDRAAAILK